MTQEMQPKQPAETPQPDATLPDTPLPDTTSPQVTTASLPDTPQVPMRVISDGFIAWGWGKWFCIHKDGITKYHLMEKANGPICLFDVKLVNVQSSLSSSSSSSSSGGKARYVWLVVTDDKLVHLLTSTVEDALQLNLEEQFIVRKRLAGLDLVAVESNDNDGVPSSSVGYPPLRVVVSDRFGDIRDLSLSQFRQLSEVVRAKFSAHLTKNPKDVAFHELRGSVLTAENRGDSVLTAESRNEGEESPSSKVEPSTTSAFEEEMAGCLAGHIASITIQRLTSDGRRLITADRDEKIVVHQYPDLWRYTSILTGHTEFVTDVCCDFADLIYSGAADKTVRLWHVDECRELACLDVPHTPLRIVRIDDGCKMGGERVAVFFSGESEVWIIAYPPGRDDSRIVKVERRFDLPAKAVAANELRVAGLLYWIAAGTGSLWRTTISADGEPTSALIVEGLKENGSAYSVRLWKHNKETTGTTKKNI